MTEGDLTVPIRVLHDITGRFETLEIPYMITGSMALFHYAIYRMTADIDIVVELKERHAQLLIDNLEPDRGLLWPSGFYNNGRGAGTIETGVGSRFTFGKQLTDIKNLLRNELDIEYIKSWITKIGVDDLFQEVEKSIEQ